jgi:hypothetical protein
MTWLTNLIAPYRTLAIAAALVAAIGIAGAAILSWRNDIHAAATGKAAATINQKGSTDADAVTEGEFDVHACRASGRVWNLAAGACVDR